MVYVRLHMLWFYVVYRFNTEDGMTMHHMFLLSRVEQLQQAVQERGIEIEEVHIVLPRHMNGKDKWTMEPLAEVWEGGRTGDRGPSGRLRLRLRHCRSYALRRLCAQHEGSRSAEQGADLCSIQASPSNDVVIDPCGGGYDLRAVKNLYSRRLF